MWPLGHRSPGYSAASIPGPVACWYMHIQRLTYLRQVWKVCLWYMVWSLDIKHWSSLICHRTSSSRMHVIIMNHKRSAKTDTDDKLTRYLILQAWQSQSPFVHLSAHRSVAARNGIILRNGKRNLSYLETIRNHLSLDGYCLFSVLMAIVSVLLLPLLSWSCVSRSRQLTIPDDWQDS